MFKQSVIRQVSQTIRKKHGSSSAHLIEAKATVAGKTINFVRTGISPVASKKHQPAVLLMPGALGSAWTDFRPQIDKLPGLLPNWTVIAWDPPGYGRSIPPKRSFPLDFFQRDANNARHLMRDQGFERFSVLGWSDGGITAMILAAEQPEAIDKLVVWGANSYVLPEELKIYEGIRDVTKWSAKMRQPMEEVYGVDGFAQLWADWVDGITRLANATKDGDICKTSLPNITARTLIVHGAKDPMVAAEHIPYLRKNIQNTQYFEFPDGKHNVHLRYADEFNSIVADFLSQH